MDNYLMNQTLSHSNSMVNIPPDPVTIKGIINQNVVITTTIEWSQLEAKNIYFSNSFF